MLGDIQHFNLCSKVCLKNIKRVGELHHFFDRVWVRVILKQMLMHKKKKMCWLAKDIEVRELNTGVLIVAGFWKMEGGYWREKMNMSSGDAFVNEMMSQWRPKDEKYLEFVEKITHENLLDFGKFVLNKIGWNEEWDLVNLLPPHLPKQVPS